MPGWHIHSIENDDNLILNMMDKYSGVDWIGENDSRLITVAARIQYGVDRGTFTVRKSRKSGAKTEYEKRKEAIENGFLYPTYTCQAYFDKDTKELLNGAIMKTVDLFKSLEISHQTAYSDNEFIFKSFEDIKAEGFDIRIRKEFPF